MDVLDEQLAQLKLINSRSLSPKQYQPQQQQQQIGGQDSSPKKIGPAVPPKPIKKTIPQIPQSYVVRQTCEPLYSKRLQANDIAISGNTIDDRVNVEQNQCQKISQNNIIHHSKSSSIVDNHQSTTTTSYRKSPGLSGTITPTQQQQHHHHVYSNMKMTLDNPAILDQQLEALEHHKKQLEKKGILSSSTNNLKSKSIGGIISGYNKNDNNSFLNSGDKNLHVYSNVNIQQHPSHNLHQQREPDVIYSNIIHKQPQRIIGIGNLDYTTVGGNTQTESTNLHDDLPPPPPLLLDIVSSTTTGVASSPQIVNINETQSIDEYLHQQHLQHQQIDEEDDLPPPPSPVSSSYSELRRATDNFPQQLHHHQQQQHHDNNDIQQYQTLSTIYNINNVNDNIDDDVSEINIKNNTINIVGSGNVDTNVGVGCIPNNNIVDNRQLQQQQQQTYVNTPYQNDYSSTYGGPSSQNINQNSSDYYGYGTLSQSSSTYESIYEPINPRPPSQLSSRSNYSLYTSYVNGSQNSGGVPGSTTPTTLNSLHRHRHHNNKAEAEVEVLTDLLVHSMNTGGTINSNNSGNIIGDNLNGDNANGIDDNRTTITTSSGIIDPDSYGICVKCNERVVGESSGCTAMEQIYHITCFTCSQCQINLQGKPFYALDGKPYCEEDYLNTLEKCSICMKPILERILRATGKPYHPACFCCVVCGNSLDGIPFTVDATNQNYCIEDFHKKFAPRCCVCRQPIMPEPGQEETVRVVALDRSFHFECYKCEDCGLLLSSEAEGRGCYPLDGHVLCKSCNAKRVQALTSRMTTEL